CADLNDAAVAAQTPPPPESRGWTAAPTRRGGRSLPAIPVRVGSRGLRAFRGDREDLALRVVGHLVDRGRGRGESGGVRGRDGELVAVVLGRRLHIDVR